MVESIFLVAVSIGLVILLIYSVKDRQRQLEKERETLRILKENERRFGEEAGIEWQEGVLRLIDKHKYALAQERRRLLHTDAYGNIKDRGWGVEEGAEASGVFYFIHNVLRPSVANFDRGETLFGKYVLRTFGIADTIFWIERSINNACDGVEEKAEAVDVAVMSGEEYEQYCAQILEEAGWQVEGTAVTGDQGVDLIVMIDDVRVCIQCKRYSKPVGNKAVQEVVAGRTHWNGTHAVVVSNAGFTKAAQKLAESTGVLLIGDMELEDLENLIYPS
jgi:restriction system protein